MFGMCIDTGFFGMNKALADVCFKCSSVSVCSLVPLRVISFPRSIKSNFDYRVRMTSVQFVRQSDFCILLSVCFL